MRWRNELEGLEAREVPAAKLQIIHNAPFAQVRTVDVYVNDNLFLDNLPYQSATAYLDVASGTELKVDLVAANAADNKTTIASTRLNLANGSTTVMAAVNNANGTSRFVLANGRTASTSTNAFEAIVLNGSPDLASVDLRVRGVGTIGEDLAPGQFGTYRSLSAATLTAEALPGAGGIPLAAARMPLATHRGDAAVLMTSGFANALSIIAVYDDGTSETFAPQYDPAYAVSTVTSKGASVILSSARGIATQAVVAFPGAGGSARVASADLTGDSVPDLVIGSGPGILGLVRIIDGASGDFLREIEPFGNFLGGVNVATGDLNGDGTPDYVISPDDGGGPRVRAFDGKTHNQIADFFGIDDINFRGGARAAIGDFDNDGKGDLAVSAGIGGGPRVALFKGALLGPNGGPKFTGDFFAFEPELRNGAFIAVGDINGDGFDDLLVGGGPGGGPRVRAFDIHGLTLPNVFRLPEQVILADFFAGDVNERGGVRLTAKDIDGDGKDDLVVGGIRGGNTVTRTYLATGLPLSGIGIPAATTSTFDGVSPLGEVFVG